METATEEKNTSGGGGAQPEKNGSPPLELEHDAVLPFESGTLTGTFANGITYYVRQNKEPRDRADLVAVIKVGSVLEREEERGLSHLLEHLAFRATKTTPQEFEMVKELEQHGVVFGAHQNASTSFEETMYELHVPVSEDGVLDKAVHVLWQLLLQARLSDEDVDRERSIVVEEERQSRGSAQRAGENYLKLLLKDSLYAERLPIGLIDVIQKVDAATVRAYFDRNYHTQLAAVVAVGDFRQPPEEVVDLLRKTFERSPIRVDPLPPREPVHVPEHPQPRVGIFVDAEAGGTSAVLDIRLPRRKMRTVGEYRAGLVEDLFHMALNKRLAKLALGDDPPFLAASASIKAAVGDIHTAQLSVSCPNGAMRRGLRAALAELKRAAERGLRQWEVDSVKKSLAAQVHTFWLERHQRESADRCSEYVSHFLHEEAAPGIDWEAAAVKTLLEGITLKEVNGVVRRYDWNDSGGAVLHVTLPALGLLGRTAAAFSRRLNSARGSGGGDKGSNDPVTEEAMLALLKEHAAGIRGIGSAAVNNGGSNGHSGGSNGHNGGTKCHNGEAVVGAEEAEENGAEDSGAEEDEEEEEDEVQLKLEDILPKDISPGRVISRRYFPGSEAWEPRVDAHEIELSNGMIVTLRSSDFLDDEILCAGYAHGGLTELSERDEASARMAAVLCEELGVFGVPPAQMIDALAGKRASLEADVDALGRGFSGACSVADFDALLALVHALFTAEVRFDESRLATAMSYLRERVDNAAKDPQAAYRRAVTAANTGNHRLMRAADRTLLSRVDGRKSAEYFRRAFRDPAAFRLVLCGNIKLEEAVPLFEKYLASIPVPNGHARGGTNGAPPPPPLPLMDRTEVTPLVAPFPAEKISQELREPMVEQVAAVTVTFAMELGGQRRPTHEQRLDDSVTMGILGQVAERRLMEVLRFGSGSIYTVSCGISFAGAPPLVLPDDPLPGSLAVSLTCGPKDAATLRRRVVEEVQRLCEEGPTPVEVKNSIQAERLDFETQLRDNNFWLSSLALQYSSPRFAGDVAASFDATREARKRACAALEEPGRAQKEFRHFLGNCERRTEITLLPRRPWRAAAKWGAVAVIGAGAVAWLATRARQPRS